MRRISRIRTEAIAAAAFGAGVLAGRLSPPVVWLDALVAVVTVICLIVALSPSLAVKAEDAWERMPRNQRRRANLIAYRVVGLTNITVKLAMDVWAQLVIAGRTTKEQNARVRVAFAGYKEMVHELKAFLETHDYDPIPDEWSAFTTGITPKLAGIIGELLKKTATQSVSDTSKPPLGRA